MNASAAIVDATVKQFTPTIRVSGFLTFCLKVLHKIHRVWHWYRRAEVYTNPDNFLKLAAGHAINWVAGNNTILRVAAQVVLIATRIAECIQEQVALWKDVKRFFDDLFGRHSLPQKIKWKKVDGKALISPSMDNGLRLRLKNLASTLWKGATSAFLLLKRLFSLSMHIMDAIDTFSYSPSVHNQAVNELFINCTKWMDTLINNKEALLGCLKENRKIISVVLHGVHSLFTVDQLICAVTKSIAVTENVRNGINSASEVVGVVGKDILQRAAFGLFQTAGLTQFMPRSWVPPLDPPWLREESSVTSERFPPVKWVTIKKYLITS